MVIENFGTLEQNECLFIGKQTEEFPLNMLVSIFMFNGRSRDWGLLWGRGLWRILEKSENETIQHGCPCFAVRFKQANVLESELEMFSDKLRGFFCC